MNKKNVPLQESALNLIFWELCYLINEEYRGIRGKKVTIFNIMRRSLLGHIFTSCH